MQCKNADFKWLFYRYTCTLVNDFVNPEVKQLLFFPSNRSGRNEFRLVCMQGSLSGLQCHVGWMNVVAWSWSIDVLNRNSLNCRATKRNSPPRLHFTPGSKRRLAETPGRKVPTHCEIATFHSQLLLLLQPLLRTDGDILHSLRTPTRTSVISPCGHIQMKMPISPQCSRAVIWSYHLAGAPERRAPSL